MAYLKNCGEDDLKRTQRSASTLNEGDTFSNASDGIFIGVTKKFDDDDYNVSVPIPIRPAEPMWELIRGWRPRATKPPKTS
jgi:hypothetical protein